MSDKLDQIDQREQRRTREVAREYEKKGYKVFFRPELPFGGSAIRPDLIATSNDDKLVIEIVSSHRLQGNQRLAQLASLVDQQQGWRLELVVTKSQDDNRKSITLPEIERRLELSQEMSDISPDAALVYAWSAAEALLRDIYDSVPDNVVAPRSLVKTLYSEAKINRSTFDALNVAIDMRNSIAHGYVPDEDQDLRRVTMALIKVAQDLLIQLRDESIDLTVDDLIRWFFDNYEDPAQAVPYEGEYVYYAGGPYDPWEELSAQFVNIGDAVIDEAAKQISSQGVEWVRKGQY